MGLTVFTVAWILESAFHTGVTVWAVGQLEAGEPVPELFHQLKSWLNVYLQWMVNPLAFLSFIGLTIASLRAGALPFPGASLPGRSPSHQRLGVSLEMEIAKYTRPYQIATR